LSQLLREELQPSGDDLAPLVHRSDDSFSQKVRNVFISDPSRNNSLPNRGFVVQEGERNSPWHITEAGLLYLAENEPDSLEDLQLASHALQEQGIETPGEPQPPQNYAGVIIEEGAVIHRSVKQRTRSRRLRDAAITVFRRQHDGRLFCTVCGFDFEAIYRELGRDFIEVHHTEIIREGEPVDLMIALERVVPLCANCHRMIHRRPGVIIALQELRAIVADT